MSTGWTRLQPFPLSNSICKPVLINNDELVVATQSFQGTDVTAGLYKYSIHNNEWKLLTKYPKYFKSASHPRLNVNKNSKQLYIHGQGTSSDSFIKYNLETQTFTKTHDISSYFSTTPNAIFCEDEYHIIGGDGTADHLIWRDDQQTFEEIFKFPVRTEYDESLLIYLPTKRLLLSFGGWDVFNPLDHVWCYSLNDKKWTKWDVIMSVFQFQSCVATEDENHIIMFGKKIENPMSIFDVNNMEFTKIDHPLPMRATFYAVIVSYTNIAKEVVSGYVRRCWQLKGFDNMMYLPIDIITMIELWYTISYIHLISGDANHHFKIPLHVICETINDKQHKQ